MGRIVAAAFVLATTASPAWAQDPTANGSSAPAASKDEPTKTNAEEEDDKEAFRSCVSKRILEAHKADFDAWYAVWQGSVGKIPAEKWTKITVKDDGGGQFKLDEN